jgi:hypothetical protein
MSFRLPKSLSLLSLPILALLASCSGPDKNTFAPACPRAAILGDAADLTRYRDGGGRDLTDLVLAGRILGVSGKCAPGDTFRQLATSLQVNLELTRGPAMMQRQVDVAIFVAVSEGDTILDKKLFPMHAVFPPNIDTIRLTTDAIAMVLPISKDKSGAAYALTAGFQLTPAELDQNRSRAAR